MAKCPDPIQRLIDRFEHQADDILARFERVTVERPKPQNEVSASATTGSANIRNQMAAR